MENRVFKLFYADAGTHGFPNAYIIYNDPDHLGANMFVSVTNCSTEAICQSELGNIRTIVSNLYVKL